MSFKDQAHKQVQDGTASEVVVKAVELDKMATKAGFGELGDTFYQWGTELAASGKESFKDRLALQENWDFGPECAEKFGAVIAAEKRRDRSELCSGLSFDTSTGQIVTVDGGFEFTKWSLGQLLTRANAPSGTTSVFVPGDAKHQKITNELKKQLFDYYMAGARNKKKESPDVMLRTRELQGRPQIFGAVSSRYQRYDADQATREFVQYADPSAKGRIKYDGHKWKMSLGTVSNIEPNVGDIFEASVFLTGADDGSAPIVIGSEVTRARCINLTVLTSEITNRVSHRAMDMKERVYAYMKQANEQIAEFTGLWKKASLDAMADREVIEKYGVDKLFQLIAQKRLVHIPGVDEETMAGRLFSAWTAEPGYMSSDILNAITRAANSNAWPSAWNSEEISEQAGQLLYNYVYFDEKDFQKLEA